MRRRACDSPCSGVISGLALKAVREHVSVTQVELAEQLMLDVSTIKGWESGRRPLGHARGIDVAALRFHLQLLGATATQLAFLDEAVRADWLLGAITTHDKGPHPLAHQVVTRGTNQLLAWPLTGIAPERLHSVRTRPVLGAGQRQHVYAALRSATHESLTGPPDDRGPLLRRNAYYLLADDDASRGWLRDAASAEKRRMPRLDRWSPEWVLHRSLAVARAIAGDREPLLAFLDRGLVSDDTLAASLNYWAAWCGDDPAAYHSDNFMVGDLGTWRGDVLLASLTNSLTTRTAYLELCIRAVWALLARRPHLLDGSPVAAADLQDRITTLLDTPGAVVSVARRDLQQIEYILKWRLRT